MKSEYIIDNIAKLINLHDGHAVPVLGPGFIILSVGILTLEELCENTSFIKTRVHEATDVGGNIRALVMAERARFKEADYSVLLGCASKISMTCACRIEELRNMKTPEYRSNFEFNRAPSTRTDDPLKVLFNELDMPEDRIERDNWLVRHFGNFYTLINSKCKKEIEEVEKTPALQLFLQLPELRRQGYPEFSRYSWAMGISDDPMKCALSYLFTRPQKKDFFDPGIVHINGMFGAISRQQRDNERTTRELSTARSSAGEKAKRIGELERELSTAKSEAEKYKQLAESPQTPAPEQPKPDDLAAKLAKAVGEAHGWEGIALESQGKVSKLEGDLQTSNRYNQMLETLLRQAREKKTDKTLLANGTGISIYASPDLQKRYRSVLHDYKDQIGSVKLHEIIDLAIKQVCHIITDRGAALLQSEFDYMRQVQCHFYKAGKIRIFFKPDIDKKTLTIADVITPEEHNDEVRSRVGRYGLIIADKIKYDFSEKNRIPLRHSVCELMKR